MLTTATEACTADYKFTGKERDTETLLDNFGARYNSSSLGRYMTADWAAKPISVPYANFGDPRTLNLYSYGGNNSVSFRDRDGHCVDGVTTVVCVVVVAAAVATIAGAIFQAHKFFTQTVPQQQQESKTYVNDILNPNVNPDARQARHVETLTNTVVEGVKTAAAVNAAANSVGGVALGVAGAEGAVVAKTAGAMQEVTTDAVKRTSENVSDALKKGSEQDPGQNQKQQQEPLPGTTAGSPVNQNACGSNCPSPGSAPQ
jgi:RHS repeat-associated protein